MLSSRHFELDAARALGKISARLVSTSSLSFMRMTLARLELTLDALPEEARAEDGEDAELFIASAREGQLSVRATFAFRKPTKGQKTWAQVERHRARFDDARAQLEGDRQETLELTTAAVRVFVERAKDPNPLYVDPEAAEMAGLPGPIVPPLLLAQALAAQTLGCDLALARPVLVNETLNVVGNAAHGALVSAARGDVVAIFSLDPVQV